MKPVGNLSKQTLHRMPYYLQYLKKLEQEGLEVVSAPTLAKHFKQTEIQVRKDLAAISADKGMPKKGFVLPVLIRSMEELLGYNNVDDAVIVGIGSLGKALLSYTGFADYGLSIVAAFDRNDALVGGEVGGVKVLHADQLHDLCVRLHIKIGIITVPAEAAQETCDILVSSGVCAIWNFAPIHLETPENVLTQNENMAASLALLSKHLREKLEIE